MLFHSIPESQYTQEFKGLTQEMERVKFPWDYYVTNEFACLDGKIMLSMWMEPAEIAEIHEGGLWQ
jgi:hypothetical protein